jgi:hypothetical protein
MKTLNTDSIMFNSRETADLQAQTVELEMLNLLKSL